ncbi:MAG TPA: alcohol dehydrogenase catalytic domain-containing protein [Candidatus Binatia bacterium]|jgi:alcohol dehydrogenase|nr:alcohol dehydrogenase catalytic domain-containing protein [Candidatus Binatia bacterium]
MRQLTCVEAGSLVWLDVPEPRLEGDGDALVRPLAVARCDLDRFLAAGFFPLRGPFAVGHECVGEIIALGDGVRGLEIGQRVVVAFQVSCGRCRQCKAGHTAICDAVPTLSDYGMQPLSGVEYGGMLSDVIRVPHAEAMLRPIASSLDPVALASVSDNVPDGYRAVAPHLATHPGSDVLIVSHGAASIPLYAALSALALGADRVDFASGDAESLALAERIGAHPIETDFGRPARTYPIVVDAGTTPEGLKFAIRATEPEGICQSVSFHPGPAVPVPMGRMYTLGIKLFVGRCHAAALLPEVVQLIESGRLAPQAITTRVVGWEEAPEAFLEPGIKLVVRRD